MRKATPKKNSPSETPMMRQYNRIKAEFPDTILFYRMGDFYEMFGSDAVTASQVLGIALTSRNKGEDAIPMAGVPHHSSDSYLNRLVKAGYNVAICDQVEDPKTAKGIVKREVVRVITPGTVYEENILPTNENVYLCALKRDETVCSIAYCDVSTGDFAVDSFPTERILGELNRLTPREVLVPSDDPELMELVNQEFCVSSEACVETIQSAEYSCSQNLNHLCDRFSLDLSEITGKSWKEAACALFSYLHSTQRGNLGQFTRLRDNALSGCLAVDSRSLRNLEIVSSISGKRASSLLGVCDFTATQMGSRLLRNWIVQPLTDIPRIEKRQGGVSAFRDNVALRDGVVKCLKNMCDLERVTARIAAGRATPRDLGSLRATLFQIASLRELLDEAPYPIDEAGKKLVPLPDILDSLCEVLVDNPPNAIGDSPVVCEGVDPELDELRAIHKGGKTWIAEYQRLESNRTGVPNLKIGYNSVFGYYIEITKAQLRSSEVPEDYIRKQTLINAERYITPELKEYESRVLSAADKIILIETRIFRELRDRVASKAREFYELASLVSSLDVLAGFARLCEERQYVIPEIHDGLEIDIRDGRHPVVEEMITAGSFVPNNTAMDSGSLIHIITGPNMAGKSTYIRQVAQIIILAQTGAPVPASYAKIGLVDRLYTRIGAGDDLARGRSTFMVEMLETAEILNYSTPRSFIILDEVGRGTSTFDGLSLAWAITEYIHDNRSCNARTLFATHYHELTEMAKMKKSVRNFNVVVREFQGKVIFLHRIEPGFSDRSYGIHVGKLAGLPAEVINRADKILHSLEKQSLDIEGKPRKGAMRNRRQKNEVQLLLFESPYEYLLDDIRDLDLDSMTPLEAFQFLLHIKKELNS